MSTELKGVQALDCEIGLTSFYGGEDYGRLVSMRIQRIQPDASSYLQLTQKQALDLAVALIEFANDTRAPVE